MLCLRRKESQSIRIGAATITIQRISGSVVRIAIDAPKDIKVLRGELETKGGAA